MIRSLRLLLVLTAAVPGIATPSAVPASEETVAAVRCLFASPSREYASAPLWVWNDRLTEEQIRSTLRDLAAQHVRQAFVHPRPGLMTPYLSEEWFALWKAALDEAEKLDMNIWIYDENSYPSGFAGGWAPERMPESRGMGLHFREVNGTPSWSETTVAVHRFEGGQAVEVTAAVRSGQTLPPGRYLVGEIRRARNAPWFGGRCYVNLLTPGVTEEFLEVTHEAYAREIGDQFGRRVPGSFTDEPQLRPAGGLPWCSDLPEQFQRRWGYDLIQHLPALVREVGDWRRVRHNYFRVLNDLFIERWAKPYHDWCEAHGLAFTGHYWDHEWPNCVGVPDNMAMAAWQQMPGIDCLMNQYAEHTHAQFGNLRFVRELASVANQLGRKRRLCEVYGAGGWDLRFVDMKRIADWLGVLGVNFFDEHLSYITIRGARKRDHPQSFSYHEPWWPDYHVMADYLARLAVAMSAGEQVNRLLVIEPTTTAWMYQGQGDGLGRLGRTFFDFLKRLESAQIEYDLVSEDVMRRHGSVESGGVGKPALRIGQRVYQQVLLPPGTENLDTSTLDLLERAAPGLTVWCVGSLPSRVDGQVSERCRALAERASGWRMVSADQALARLPTALPTEGLRLARAPDDAGILFHQRRRLTDGDLLLLVNTSLESPSRGRVWTERSRVEAWDLFTGRVAPYPSKPEDGGRLLEFDLPPAGSLLLCLSSGPVQTASSQTKGSVEILAPSGRLRVQRLEPNVLTLDYVDVSVGQETRKSIYFYEANRWIWQKHGLSRNPWDSAVQFRDELISKRFPAESGFTARYRFQIRDRVPADLAIVIERPDLYRSITCNGIPVRPTPDAWWLDHAFGRIPLAKAARPGTNVVEIMARPMTMEHELESAYLVGSFSLEPAERGFVLVPERPLEWMADAGVQVHGIHPDGTMWLSAGIGFTKDAQGRPVEDRRPWVEFDLGGAKDLSALRIWNYGEGHVRDLTSRGVRELRILTATEPGDWSEAGRFQLARASGPAQAEVLPLKKRGVRRVRLEPLSNHAGVRYPAEGSPPDNGFVGLAEVQFLDAQGEVIPGARVAATSSELASFNRTADHLVDGSGLHIARRGWKDQGMPFYAGAVAYEQTYEVAAPQGRYFLRLEAWNGSVARVRVNGRLAGHIVAPPWECELTPWMRPGANRIAVEIVGTLKNTLGPHHGNPPLGSAWPGSFQRGPNPGPPPGDNYSTVAYGLFAPPILERR